VGAQPERRNVRRSRRSRTEDTRPSDDEFALRLGSIDDLFWPLDATPVAERKLNEDVRCSTTGNAYASVVRESL
jgi:hypothetical protein